jgi:plastocyanin
MRRLALLPTVAALLTLTACSGGSSPAATAAGGGASPAASAAAESPAAASGAGGGGALACATADAGATAASTVTIKDFKFTPQPVQAKVGDVIAWSNQDSAPHSATMDDGSCDTKTIDPGKTMALKFTAAGTYTYHCSIHPSTMKGFTVVVQ